MTKILFSGGILAALLTVIAAPASADELNFYTASPERPNIISARTGMAGAIVGELSYRRILGLTDRLAVLGLDLSAPMAELDTGDYSVRATLALPLIERKHWKLIAALGPTLRSAENALNRSYALGADARATFGYYGPRWFVASELGTELVGGAYIQNSARYRKYVYADVKDGWYRDTGGSFYVGIHGGISLSGIDVVLRLAHLRAWTLQPKNVPVLATIGVNAAF